ncbi:MAG: hypothetical protein JWR26_2015 [Pedosphaera sp.]|nr:hypothetical protein [Pedosphaera sp.]
MPPLPSTSTEENHNSLARQAAKASIIAPLLVLGLSYCCNSVFKNPHDPSGRSIILVQAVVSCLLVVAGLILGIVALVCMKPGGRGPIIFSATAGILMSSLFFAIFVPNFVRAREKALAQRKAYEDVTVASRDLLKKSLTALKEDRSVTPAHLVQTLDNASKGATGDEAALMKGASAYFHKVQILQAAYTKASKELTAAHVLSSDDLTDREQLRARKAVVQKFLDANDTLKNFVRLNEENFQKELVSQNASASGISSAMGGFHETAAIQTPLLVELRTTDTRIGQAMLGVLDLLDSNWGEWRYNATNDRVTFNNTIVLDKYTAYLGEIKSASKDQSTAKNQLAKLVRSQVSKP